MQSWSDAIEFEVRHENFLAGAGAPVFCIRMGGPGRREIGHGALAEKALLPVLNSLVDEIKNTVHFHEEHAASKITRLLLAGGSSKLLHLPSFLQEKL